MWFETKILAKDQRASCPNQILKQGVKLVFTKTEIFSRYTWFNT